MMTPAAKRLSSQTLQQTKECSPPIKISLLYSSIAFLESPALGTYLITTVWSGQLLGLRESYMSELSSMSLMHSDLETSFDLNCFSDAKFLPSLLPRWLQDTQDLGFMPAVVRKSIKEVLNLVWPVLKSLPIRILSLKGVSLRPLTKVFWGEPLMNTQPYWIAANAKIVEGAISGWLFPIAFIKLLQVSLTPAIQSANLSVLALHNTITVERFFQFLKAAMSLRIVVRWSSLLLPYRRLLARSYWLLAMKSGQQMDLIGRQSLRRGSSLSCRSQSKTLALFIPTVKSQELMSQPVIQSWVGSTKGITSLIFIHISPYSESATFIVEH